MTNQYTFQPHPVQVAQAKSSHVYTTHLNGCWYGDAHHLIKDLRQGQELLLAAVTGNKFDKYAVPVYVNDGAGRELLGDTRVSLLGYLPAKENYEIKLALWKLMANGVKLTGKLSSFSHRDGCVSNAIIEIHVGG